MADRVMDDDALCVDGLRFVDVAVREKGIAVASADGCCRFAVFYAVGSDDFVRAAARAKKDYAPCRLSQNFPWLGHID